MSILIKNGRVIDPANNLDEPCDIYIEASVIKQIGKHLCLAADKTLDAAGMWVVPGLIDIHTHLREPGFEYKETIETGSKSAAAGGFTTICCMPNCKPVTDSREAIENMLQIIKETAVINVLPVGSITEGQNGTRLADIRGMASSGAAAISEDGKTVTNAKIMKHAMLMAKQCNIPVLAHCEDVDLVNDTGFDDEPGIPKISNDSEDVIVAREIALAASTGAKLHICHMSTAGSAELLRRAKATNSKGTFRINVSGEAAPHHFTLTDNDVISTETGMLDPNFKMNPPLRSRKDVDAIISALKDGTIEVIATDHAPHHISEKVHPFETAANGIIGLETALSLGITQLVDKNILSPTQLIEKMTINPARVIGIPKGTLAVNSSADITVINPNEAWTVDSSKFYSKAVNTPFNGMKLKGRVKYTIVAGEIVFADPGEGLKLI